METKILMRVLGFFIYHLTGSLVLLQSIKLLSLGGLRGNCYLLHLFRGDFDCLAILEKHGAFSVHNPFIYGFDFWL